MLNRFIRPAIALFILISGLVSCGPDKPDKNIYAAPTPVLHRSGQSISTIAWSHAGKRELDLHDELDFQASTPSQIVVQSDCQVDAQHIQTSRTFNFRSQLRILDILPEPVLGKDLNASPIDCNFEISIFNDEGSNRVFFIGPARLEEKRETSVAVDRLAGLQTKPFYRNEDFGALRVRFENSKAATARVACSDFSTPEIPFQRSLDFSLFDFKKADSFDPHQFCRVVISDGETGVQASSTLTVLFSESTGKLELVSNPLSTPAFSEISQREFAKLYAGRAATLQSWKFTNASRATHRLKINAPPVETDVYFLTPRNRVVAAKLGVRSWLRWEIGQKPDLVIASHQSVELKLVAQANEGSHCNADNGVALEIKSPVSVQEIDEAGDVLSEMPLALPNKFYFMNANLIGLTIPYIESLSGRWN